jgi:hypothetical protein
LYLYFEKLILYKAIMSSVPLSTSGKEVLTILHLVTGEVRIAERFPFFIGSSEGSDWRLITGWGGGGTGSISITKGKSGVVMTPAPATQAIAGNEFDLLHNGEPFAQAKAMPNDSVVTLKVGPGLFALTSTRDPDAWVASIDLKTWNIFNGISNQPIGACSLAEVGNLIATLGHPFNECALIPNGLEAVPGFWTAVLPDIIRPSVDVEYEGEPSGTVPEPARDKFFSGVSGPVPTTQGDYSCPICWQQFEGKDIFHIASHPELTGDDILGPAVMSRFVPNDFDDHGNPLDDFGLPCPDIACPHCRHRLPLGFLELPQHIFSIVGAPSSGKSYYLAILIKQLKNKLLNEFSVSFGDQDPEYNVALNAHSTRLFSALTPEQGQIRKTDLTGGVYQKVHRNGQEVDLPQPYVFNCASNDVEGGEQSLIFYDNAGEHFLPANSTSADFHILHVAKASALFFLFDPVANIDFRRRLRGVDGVQDQLAHEKSPDTQDVILAQMNAKIKRALSIPLNRKIDIPLAVMIGKSDVWSEILDDKEAISKVPYADGCLDETALDEMSDQIRSFLKELCPGVVGNAEKISSNVRYFPVSAFGHKPAVYTLDDGSQSVIPDPMEIEPIMLEVPTVWAISQIAPDLVSSR